MNKCEFMGEVRAIKIETIDSKKGNQILRAWVILSCGSKGNFTGKHRDIDRTFFNNVEIIVWGASAKKLEMQRVDKGHKLHLTAEVQTSSREDSMSGKKKYLRQIVCTEIIDIIGAEFEHVGTAGSNEWRNN